MPRVELTGGFGEDSALQFNTEDSVNMYPVVNTVDGGKGSIKLKNTEGLKTYNVLSPSSDEVFGKTLTYSTSDFRVFVYAFSTNTITSIGYHSLYELT